MPMAVPAQVAPALATTPTGDEAMDLALWQAFRRRNIQENPDTQTAVTRALEFLRAGAATTPALHPTVAIDGWSAMGYITHRKLHDTEGALKIYDEAFALYGAQFRGPALLLEKARLFTFEGRPAQTELLVRDNWKRITHAPAILSRAILWQGCLALKAQGKTEAVPALLEKALLETPALLDEADGGSKGWIYRTLVDTLLSQGRTEEALSWAKGRWMEAAFEEAKLKDATALLARVWASQEGAGTPPGAAADSKHLAAFLAVQSDGLARPKVEIVAATAPTGGANPLAQVALPRIEASVLQEQLLLLNSETTGGLQEQSAHRLISLLIWNLDWTGAMTQAQQLEADLPLSSAGSKEIARVFKAHDLSVVRANAFLAWQDKRQGPSPVQAFLDQVQKQGAKAPGQAG